MNATAIDDNICDCVEKMCKQCFDDINQDSKLITDLKYNNKALALENTRLKQEVKKLQKTLDEFARNIA
jgi:cell division protein FtsB